MNDKTQKEAHLWATVYAAVLASLAAAPGYRHPWETLRDRAAIEANAACRLAGY